MNTEPRAATRLENFFIGTALLGMVLLIVAWQMSVVNRPKSLDELAEISARQPPPIVRQDFRPSASASDQSRDGLRAAALAQIVEAQSFGRDEYTDIWSRPECRTWDVLDLSFLSGRGRLTIHELVVVDVLVEQFDGASGEVRVVFRDHSRKTEINNDAGRAEHWQYQSGSWKNLTCHYSEGPSILQMFVDGTIRLAEPTPPR